MSRASHVFSVLYRRVGDMLYMESGDESIADLFEKHGIASLSEWERFELLRRCSYRRRNGCTKTTPCNCMAWTAEVELRLGMTEDERRSLVPGPAHTVSMSQETFSLLADLISQSARH